MLISRCTNIQDVVKYALLSVLIGSQTAGSAQTPMPATDAPPTNMSSGAAVVTGQQPTGNLSASSDSIQTMLQVTQPMAGI